MASTQMLTTTMSTLSSVATAILPETLLAETTTTKPYYREHLEHQKITFEIPTHHDLKHIDNMHNFNKLLQNIGNVMNNDAPASQLTTNNGAAINSHSTLSSSAASTLNDLLLQSSSQIPLSSSHFITNAEISKSVVLDLADLKSQSDNEFNWERFFNGADMHSIINYLWIGVVTSLIILSVIFIVFSCYFYRKFREWKKCNKDIRAHGNSNNINGELLYAHGINEQCNGVVTGLHGAAYYQMESPPCYTIATGLPSYDEALLHHHQHQQEHYYNYAFKFMYPRLASKHQLQLHQHEIMTALNGHFIKECKKSSSSSSSAEAALAGSNNIETHKMLQYDNNEKIALHCNNDDVKHQQQHQLNNIGMSTLLLKQEIPPPAYHIATSPAFYNRNFAVAATSTESIFMNDEHIEICIDEHQQQHQPLSSDDNTLSSRVSLLNMIMDGESNHHQHMDSIEGNLLDNVTIA